MKEFLIFILILALLTTFVLLEKSKNNIDFESFNRGYKIGYKKGCIMTVKTIQDSLGIIDNNVITRIDSINSSIKKMLEEL